MPNVKNKKALGIDYGLKRIGLSLSDDTQTIAFPLKYILNDSVKKTVSELKKVIEEENVGLLVIGMPIGLKGKKTEISTEIGKLIEVLKESLKEKIGDGLILTVYDERFSSVQAQRSLIEQNIKRNKRKEKIDSIASTFILQSYLDKQKNIIEKKIF
ncbi:MAG: Holliday junction resolvase RuvX [Deltaproteobacteria bacterium]|jgi:RNAse H-fold protein YqgF|uniref:Putative pre-16S rRNA nuclease n=1 Tax=Candidatus Acidulodesulfobacterium acidiphilum TaxID=2597224 RepID=A0A520XFS3_9DELT|nr:Holliday junction resolvase RuvX [Deltaproteobacteria bacterium]RZV40031.1 MAG: Holliday junction resolvase RuvX [Candidatus Acidulodesulfobacterium acidiphilum]